MEYHIDMEFSVSESSMYPDFGPKLTHSTGSGHTCL